MSRHIIDLAEHPDKWQTLANKVSEPSAFIKCVVVNKIMFTLLQSRHRTSYFHVFDSNVVLMFVILIKIVTNQ
jgi:hypothetical protein